MRRPAYPGILHDMGRETRLSTGSVTLRGANPSDLPGLVDLTVAFYEEDGFSAARADLEARFGSLLGQPEANVTVAATAHAIVGFALTTTRLILESGLVAELQDLYVDPRYRGKGVGSALVTDAAAWARANSAAMLEVVIAPNGRDVTHLQRYYGSLGFLDQGRQIVHFDL